MALVHLLREIRPWYRRGYWSTKMCIWCTWHGQWLASTIKRLVVFLVTLGRVLWQLTGLKVLLGRLWTEPNGVDALELVATCHYVTCPQSKSNTVRSRRFRLQWGALHMLCSTPILVKSKVESAKRSWAPIIKWTHACFKVTVRASFVWKQDITFNLVPL